jgi:hypothetical protein
VNGVQQAYQSHQLYKYQPFKLATKYLICHILFEAENVYKKCLIDPRPGLSFGMSKLTKFVVGKPIEIAEMAAYVIHLFGRC